MVVKKGSYIKIKLNKKLETISDPAKMTHRNFKTTQNLCKFYLGIE